MAEDFSQNSFVAGSVRQSSVEFGEKSLFEGLLVERLLLLNFFLGPTQCDPTRRREESALVVHDFHIHVLR